jgi:hypothetical protein
LVPATFIRSQRFPNTFATRGDKLRVKAGVMAAPTGGQVVQLKLYYTNLVRPELGLTHRFLGLCSMEGFSVGGLNDCDYTLPSVTINGQSVNVGSLEDAFSIDFEVNTTPSYKTRPILTALSYAGTTFATPAAKLAPSCPAPGPLVRPITVPNALIPLVSPTNPRPQWEFPSGILGSIPFNTAVLRDHLDGLGRVAALDSASARFACARSTERCRGPWSSRPRSSASRNFFSAFT